MPAKKEEVVAQIRMMLQEGESTEAITRTLLSAGWTGNEIAAVLKDAGATGETARTEDKTVSSENDKKGGTADEKAKNETAQNPAQPQKQQGDELKVVAIAAIILLLIAGIGAYFLYPYLNGENTKGCSCDLNELNPICAKDGNTYKSECKLNCAKAEKDYEGECKKAPSATATPKPTAETPPALTEIPEPTATGLPEPTDEAIPPLPTENAPAGETATPSSFPFVIPPAGGNPPGGEMPPLPG